MIPAAKAVSRPMLEISDVMPQDSAEVRAWSISSCIVARSVAPRRISSPMMKPGVPSISKSPRRKPDGQLTSRLLANCSSDLTRKVLLFRYSIRLVTAGAGLPDLFEWNPYSIKIPSL